MEKSKTSIKEKIEALKYSIKYTYKASPGMFFIILVVTILGGLITIIEPLIFKVILDKITTDQTSLSLQIGIGIGSIFLLYGVARITQSILWDVQGVIKRVHSQLIDKTMARGLMDKISSLDAVYFESPEYYTTLTKANDSVWRVNEFFWQVTFLFGQLISVIVIIGTLFAFKPLIVLLIIGGALPSLILAFKTTDVVWSAFDFYSPIRKEAFYYRKLMSERQEAIKEIKLFNLKPYFLEKFDNLFKEFISKQKKSSVQRSWTFNYNGFNRRHFLSYCCNNSSKSLHLWRNYNRKPYFLLGNIISVCVKR